MNDVIELNKKARVREQASVWLVCLQEGLNEGQKNDLESWLNLDPMHQEQFLELAVIWDELEVLTELAPLFEGVLPSGSGAAEIASNSDQTGVSWLSASIAACFLVASCCVGLFLISEMMTDEDSLVENSFDSLSPQASRESTVSEVERASLRHYRTPIGKQLKVPLSDGTIAILNTDTHIEVAFTEQQRTIGLLKGEAHFSVATDLARPLVVLVSGKSVEAVGTAFSVRKNASTEIEVAVDEGRVSIYQHAPNSTPEGLRDDVGLTTSLDAGEVLTIAGDEQQLAQYDLDEMADRLAWREGMIVINDETLDYVIQEFRRYSEQRVLLADRTMGEIRVAGYFRLGDVDALLVALEKNFNIRSEYYQDNQTYVLSEL